MTEETARLWLFRALRRKPGSAPIVEYVQLHAAGVVPQGVGLYRTRHLAKQASKFAADHPSRPVPAGLRPAAVTGAAT